MGNGVWTRQWGLDNMGSLSHGVDSICVIVDVLRAGVETPLAQFYPSDNVCNGLSHIDSDGQDTSSFLCFSSKPSTRDAQDVAGPFGGHWRPLHLEVGTAGVRKWKHGPMAYSKQLDGRKISACVKAIDSNICVGVARLDCLQPMAMVLLYTNAIQLPGDDVDRSCPILLAMAWIARAWDSSF